MEIVMIAGAHCSACGEEFTPFQFSEGKHEAWPVPCLLRFVRSDLRHPEVWGGCGGRVVLTQEAA
jgi:hypothetical protein